MGAVRRPPMRVAIVVMVCALAVVSSTHAQRAYGQRSFREGSFPPQFPPEDFADDGVTICKLMYTQVRRESWGIGWLTDYPYAAVNLMIRASELTKIHASWDARHNPYPWVVRLTDAALFQCPMIVASDVGTMGISDVEAARLREDLLKGGFLWVDDFWGTDAWEQWVSQIRKVFDATDTRLSMSLRRIRCSAPLLQWNTCHRLPISNSGADPAAPRPRSAVRTAPRSTPAPSATRAAGSWS